MEWGGETLRCGGSWTAENGCAGCPLHNSRRTCRHWYVCNIVQHPWGLSLQLSRPLNLAPHIGYNTEAREIAPVPCRGLLHHMGIWLCLPLAGTALHKVKFSDFKKNSERSARGTQGEFCPALLHARLSSSFPMIRKVGGGAWGSQRGAEGREMLWPIS